MPSSRLVRAFSMSRIIEVLSQPRDHPKELSLLVGMVILVVFAVIVLFALLFVRTSAERKRRAGKDLKLATPKELAWLLALLGWLIALGAIASYSLVASPTFCLSCHGSSRLAKDLKSTIHAKLACQDCHQTPGLAGSIAYRLEVGRMVVGKIMGKGGSAAGSASRDACLACHEGDISKTIIAKSIKMRHKEPIERGYRCEQCHFKIAHNEPKRQSAMSTCYDCHGNGKPLKCDVCHVAWVGQTNYSLSDYAKVTLSSEVTCERCHDVEKECVRCHKVPMPHTEDFKRGGHALLAGEDRKSCLDCHKVEDCIRCHPRMPGPHVDVSGWIKQHGPSSRSPKADCSKCHPQVDCLACHDDLQSFKLRTLPNR